VRFLLVKGIKASVCDALLDYKKFNVETSPDRKAKGAAMRPGIPTRPRN